MNGKMTIVQVFEDSNLLLKGVFRNFIRTFKASSLGNMLTGKGILRASYGNKKGKGMLRDGY